jgi:hypothetical protein
VILPHGGWRGVHGAEFACSPPLLLLLLLQLLLAGTGVVVCEATGALALAWLQLLLDGDEVLQQGAAVLKGVLVGCSAVSCCSCCFLLPCSGAGHGRHCLLHHDGVQQLA